VSEEALREAVLLETLARLLREKMGNGQAAVGGSGASTAIPPWRRTQESGIPPPIGSTPVENAERASPTEKVEAPLEKFIRVFGLDELAAKCLLKLQDDEAAFVIESCQHRLKYAKNPSAVVMIAIRGVAAKVGRRYYGSRETAEGDETKSVGELKMIGGSPEDELPDADVAETDPYLGMMEDDAEEEEEEEDHAEDQEVDISDSIGGQGASAPPTKRQRTESSQQIAPSELLKERLTVEVPAESAQDPRDDQDDALFFVDTGGA